MNKLPREKRVQILSMLCEGSSMRAISRVADVSINTVAKLLVDAGQACARFHFNTVRNVAAKRVQCDEIWSFCYAKEKNVRAAKAAPVGAGNVWTWTALDADSKMILSWMVGGREADTALLFIDDLKDRVAGRMQLTTDGHRAYLNAIETAFGPDEIDYAMLVKLYGESPDAATSPERKYSPSVCLGARKEPQMGDPDADHISTSYVERHNLTMRMSMKRFARLGNAFSKKIDNHVHALSLYFVWYNFARTHKAHKVSPAMQAGVASRLWSMEDIANLIEAAAPKPGPRGPYRKRQEVTLPGN